jgi:hypothetical protein
MRLALRERYLAEIPGPQQWLRQASPEFATFCGSAKSPCYMDSKSLPIRILKLRVLSLRKYISYEILV